MVDEQIVRRQILDSRVVDAMRKIPRHRFVPKGRRAEAYEDHPLQIGYGQTISQPYIVAKMTELLGCKGDEKLLEIGTGSGYQTAVLAEVAKQVFSIEIVESLFYKSLEILGKYSSRIRLRCGDGYVGWPEEAPFDGILLTAAPAKIPEPLKTQVKLGGKIIAPVGTQGQELIELIRTPSGFERRTVFSVRFVPMTGLAMESSEFS